MTAARSFCVSNRSIQGQEVRTFPRYQRDRIVILNRFSSLRNERFQSAMNRSTSHDGNPEKYRKRIIMHCKFSTQIRTAPQSRSSIPHQAKNQLIKHPQLSLFHPLSPILFRHSHLLQPTLSNLGVDISVAAMEQNPTSPLRLPFWR